MHNVFKLAGFSLEMVPAITKYGFEDLGDDPASHRWRAWWALSDIGSQTGGIELRAYPVIKVNPASVWIDEWAGRQASKQPWEDGAPAVEWVSCGHVKRRLLHNDANAAWAKPTQDQAVQSLAVRLCRWTGHLARELERAESAIKAMETLRPDLKIHTQKARFNLSGGNS